MQLLLYHKIFFIKKSEMQSQGRIIKFRYIIMFKMI